MFKKILAILVGVFLLFQFGTTQTFAVGQTCCPDGYVYRNGRCQRDTTQVCTFAAVAMCGVQNAGNLTQICVDGGKAACQLPFNAQADLSAGIPAVCKALVGGLLIYAKVPPPDQTVLQLMWTGCETSLNLQFGSTGLITETACAPQETCSGNVCYEASTFFLCSQVPNEYRSKCQTCLNADGVWTGVGCVEQTASGAVGKLIQVGMGIAGGIALLMILVASFMLATSEGEPKRTSEAREILTAAIIGLLFIIFSVTILQFIGVTILQIPEFGT